jgi:hypothetical protein
LEARITDAELPPRPHKLENSNSRSKQMMVPRHATNSEARTSSHRIASTSTVSLQHEQHRQHQDNSIPKNRAGGIIKAPIVTVAIRPTPPSPVTHEIEEQPVEEMNANTNNNTAANTMANPNRMIVERLPSFDNALKDTIERARANELQRLAKIVAQMEAQYQARKARQKEAERLKHLKMKQMALKTRFKAKKITGSSTLSRTRFIHKKTELEVNGNEKDREEYLTIVLAGFAYLIILIWYLVTFVDFESLFGDGEEQRVYQGWFHFCYNLDFEFDIIYILTVL